MIKNDHISNLQEVYFGDIVRNVDESVRNAQSCELDRYVGLEHIDPESLHIERWGLISNGTSFTRRFRKGQVLFGKRRAYQRKVAVAEFDGLCSSDILVFEPADERLIPELLPFICQSDGFFEHTLDTSAGSLSPRTKFKELARYKFPLPSLDEQRRIAEILWAADKTINLYQDTLISSKQVFEESLKQVMKFGLREHATNLPPAEMNVSNDWSIQRLDEIALVERGKFAHRPRNLPVFYGGPYPFVQTSDIANSNGKLVNCSQTLSEKGKSISRSFPKNSILMTIAAIIGKTAITDFEVWCTDSVVGIIPNKKIRAQFLEYFLRTLQEYLEKKAATQTAQKNINLGILRPLLIPVPSLGEQLEIEKFLLSLEEVSIEIEAHISNLKKIYKAILAQYFL